MTLFAGATSPETLVLTVDTVDGFNLAGITGTEFSVVDPDGAARSWAWALTSASAASVVLTHTFAGGGGDAPIAGDYVVSGWLLTGATRTRRINPVHIPFERYT